MANGFPKSIKVNGHERIAVNALSCGPGCTPHTYVLETSIRGRVEHVRKSAPVGWVLENGAAWIPEISGYGQIVTVEVPAAENLAAARASLARVGVRS